MCLSHRSAGLFDERIDYLVSDAIEELVVQSLYISLVNISCRDGLDIPGFMEDAIHFDAE